MTRDTVEVGIPVKFRQVRVDADKNYFKEIKEFRERVGRRAKSTRYFPLEVFKKSIFFYA